MTPADTSEGITWAKVPGGFKIVDSDAQPSDVRSQDLRNAHAFAAEAARQATLPQTMSGWWELLWA